MYESFLAQVNSYCSVELEEMPHSPNHSSPIEQADGYNSEGILADTPHLESMILILTHTIAYPLLEENHTNHESSIAKICITSTNTCEHRLEKEHAQDKTSFIETMIGDAYKCDYEVFDYMIGDFTVQC